MIIDAHTHTFPERVAARAIPKMEAMAQSRAYTDGTDAALIRSMQEADIAVSVLLPVATNTAQVEKLNRIALEKNEHFAETHLFSLGAMHPDFEGYRSALAAIRANGITGIKLHPAYQNTDLDDLRFMRIIERAAELDMAVVIHAGLDIGIMHHNFSSVSQICTILKEIQPPKLVLAHMGGWKGWDEAERTLTGESVYMDTAFVLGSYEPPEGVPVPVEKRKMLGGEQLKRMTEKHGYDKILFGTDSPWSRQKETVQKINACGLAADKLPLIMGDNAKKVFQIPDR